MKTSASVLLVILLPANGIAQYVGAAACAPCHPARFKEQSASEHAHALRRATPDEAGGVINEASYRYEVRGTSTGLSAHVVAGKLNRTIPIDWAFGAGDQATTFVSQLDEDAYVEHRFSLYSRTGTLGLTPGHRSAVPATWPEAAGVVYSTFGPEAEIMRCFGCHSTGKLGLGPKMDIVPAELGVRCEACHGPGAEHVKAMQRADVAGGRKSIHNPGRLTSAAQNEFCGTCHRMPARGENGTDWRDPWNVRHQPVYLAQSACFRKSQGALSCLTCHSPHQPLKRNDAAFYDGKCMTCHRDIKHPAVAQSDSQSCTSCHMPVVAPRDHLTFANHWIGIYRPGAALRPIRTR